jgi:hypothetical protein
MVPNSFKCPITQEVMTDPVMCNDGHSYERHAIERWFAAHDTSPMTNVVISKNIVSNHSLRNSIQEYLNQPVQTITNNVADEEHDYPDVECYAKVNGNYCEICVGDVLEKNKVSLVISIDVSASMNESAGIQGNEETQCYSRLDLVKHAVLCVIETLEVNDNIAIVEYSDQAQVLYPMQKVNKVMLKQIVNSLYTKGSTNLWDGIEVPLNMCGPDDCVLLFTDGQATSGLTDVKSAFRRYLNNNKNSADVYTFGFSNCVNSDMLNDIAVMGNGQFNFISDSAMLFTVMVNFLANYYTKYGNLYINNEYHGQIYYGQKKVIKYNGPITRIQIDYENVTDVRNGEDINVNRANIIDVLKSRNERIIKDFIDNLQNRIMNEIDVDMCENLKNEVLMAFQNQYYNKWGKHYIYAFTNAVYNQINTNFKDSYLQHFGGTMFHKLQDKFNGIVANLHPPQPSLTYRGRQYQVNSMNTFNNRSNPCFAGNNKVLMGDNTRKLVKQVKRGDIVKTSEGNATVTCVVKTVCKDNLTELSVIDKLIVTPWHPIKYNNVWTFPQNVNPARIKQCEAVYSFILDKIHVMIIEDYEVITLGHNYDQSILSHSYWGTNAVIDDLKKKDGFDNGLVVLKAGTMKIDNTGLVCSL